MIKILFSIWIMGWVLGSPLSVQAAGPAEVGSEEDMQSLISKIESSSFPSVEEKTQLIDIIRAAQSPIQKRYVAEGTRKWLAEKESRVAEPIEFAYPFSHVFLAVAAAKKGSGKDTILSAFQTQIIRDGTLDLLIELGVKGNSFTLIHNTLLLYYQRGHVSYLKWFLNRFKRLSSPDSMYIIPLLCGHPFVHSRNQEQMESFLQEVEQMLERTHLRGRPNIDRVGLIYSIIRTLDYLRTDRDEERRQFFNTVVERFNEERRLGRLTEANEQEVLEHIIGDSTYDREGLPARRAPDLRAAVPAFAVHNYANAAVDGGDDAGAGAAGCARPQKLNDAVLEKVQARLGPKKIKRETYENAVRPIRAIIESKYGSQPAQLALAHKAIEDGLRGNAQAQQELADVYQFLQVFHPHKMDLWIDQFIRESIEAYEGRANPLSCVKGIQERIVLGLRGIDEELDRLFAQAEGPEMMKTLFAQLNFGERDHPEKAKFVASQLIRMGYTQKTTPAQAGKLLERFLTKKVNGSRLSKKDKAPFLEQISPYGELVEGDLEGGKDSILKPYLDHAVRNRAATILQKAYRKVKEEKTKKASGEKKGAEGNQGAESLLARYHFERSSPEKIKFVADMLRAKGVTAKATALEASKAFMQVLNAELQTLNLSAEEKKRVMGQVFYLGQKVKEDWAFRESLLKSFLEK